MPHLWGQHKQKHWYKFSHKGKNLSKTQCQPSSGHKCIMLPQHHFGTLTLAQPKTTRMHWKIETMSIKTNWQEHLWQIQTYVCNDIARYCMELLSAHHERHGIYGQPKEKFLKTLKTWRWSQREEYTLFHNVKFDHSKHDEEEWFTHDLKVLWKMIL